MIVVTGGAGFIGSNLISTLNDMNKDVILVDDMNYRTWKNIIGLNIHTLYTKDGFLTLMRGHGKNSNINIEAIIHLGATSSTDVYDIKEVMNNNYHYTMEIIHFCRLNNIRLLYASTAATYGSSDNFSDDHSLIPTLKPLNLYSFSKHLIDLHVVNSKCNNIVGMKFFNVYGGINESHKNNMKSFITYICDSVKDDMNIDFLSMPNIPHDKLSRDFIHIDDVIKIILFFLENKDCNGIYNVGSGISTLLSFIIEYVYSSFNKIDDIKVLKQIPSAKDFVIQTNTKADITKLKRSGYNESLISVEDGIDRYIKFLKETNHQGDFE